MTTQQNIAFVTLLQRWNHHEILRDQRAPIADLATSRTNLDAARLDCARSYSRIAA